MSTDQTSRAERPGPVLLDREDDLAALDAALAETLAGNGRVLLIEGPAGIGKTGLLDALRQKAGAMGVDALTARSGELEQDFGFGVVRQLLEARLMRADEGERAKLLAGAARLSEPVFTADAGVNERGDVAYATLHGLYWLVANLAERNPLLLAVDDAHWADPPSLRFLLHLARRLAGMPVLIALTVRTGLDVDRDEVRSLLLESLTVLRPTPLGEAAVAAVVRATLGPGTADDLCGACAESTRGNPFLLSELTGELRREARMGRDIDPARVRRLAPERIAAAVLRRVGRLEPAALALARSIAVLGDQARLGNCATLAEVEPERARALADALTELEVLEPGEPLRFVHPIVRTVVYDDIPAVLRAALHAGAARLLADQYAEPGMIAVHLLARDPCGDPNVVNVLLEASRRAVSGGAPDTAAVLLRRALEEPPDDRDRPEVLFELGRAEHELGLDVAVRHLRDAAETASDPVTRGRALTTLAWTTNSEPRLQRQQLPLYEQAAREVRSHDRELALQLEAARLGALLFNPDLPARFEEEAERFRDLPAKSAAECFLLSFAARRALEVGDDPAEAADLAERAAAHSALTYQAGHPLWRMNVGLCLMGAERYELAERLFTRAISQAERAGSPQWFARASMMRGLTRHRRGDLRGAEADSRASFDARGLGGTYGPQTILFPLVESLTDLGRGHEAEALLADNGLDGDLVPVMTSVWPLAARGRMRATIGNLTAARADLEQALHLIEALRRLTLLRSDARVALTQVLHALGEDAAARDLADESLKVALASRSRRAIGGALRVAGLVHGGDRGLELLRRSVATLATSPSLLWRAEALVDLGAAMRRAGQRSEARPVLREGMELAHKCAAAPLADRAADELRAAGARPRRRAGTGADALTASERRVAELAASGMNNKEIAQSLFVTLRTVEMHLSNAYTKLEIPSRQGLAAALRD